MKTTANRIHRTPRNQPVAGGMRATIFSVQRSDQSTSRQITYEDEFAAAMTAGNAQFILPTPYDVSYLFRRISESNMLRQCIDAYTTNTVGTGWETADAIRERKANKNEKKELQSFIDHANSEESLTAVMSAVIRDRESVGFGFLEIIRDAANSPSLFRWASSLITRLCVKIENEVEVKYDIPRGKRLVTVTEFRKFRRFVQIVNGRQRWFKEFGDPRKMDARTGAFENEAQYKPGFDATEILHFRLPSNEPYGEPRWINHLPSIIGSRESEEVNMRYFEDNTIPPMLLTVAGGRLTAPSYQELLKAINTGMGKDRQHGMMLLEAVGEGDSLDGKASPVTLKLDKLTDARQNDGVFKDYDQANQGKVRSSWRLPPIVVGQSQDVNFATANVSAFVAESQVFAPARAEIDEILNKKIVNGKLGLNMGTVKLVSRTPAITSPDMLIKTMTALNVMGALTPRMAQKLANAVLQVEITPYPAQGEQGYEPWMDKPVAFEMRKGRDANGNEQPDDTHLEQSNKTDLEKDVEETGDVSQRAPKHGEE